jgi:hypothetical protein
MNPRHQEVTTETLEKFSGSLEKEESLRDGAIIKWKTNAESGE